MFVARDRRLLPLALVVVLAACPAFATEGTSDSTTGSAEQARAAVAVVPPAGGRSDAEASDELAAVEDQNRDETEADDSEGEEPQALFRLTEWLMEQPALMPRTPYADYDEVALPAPALDLQRELFGSDRERLEQYAQYRRQRLSEGFQELVFGSEGQFRVATDGGNMLGKSNKAPSVRTQLRQPITTEPRIRGSRTGRLIASGSYWAPAREDLDSVLSKVDSATIRDVVVIKGPYTSMLGPGFTFIDFRFHDSPRSANGFQWEASSAVEYKTNGQQLFGRQTVLGAAENYGYRVSYGHRTGNDYATGAGWELPTSYNSRYFDTALGYDFSPDSRLEFNYLRLDQTNVEFPGLVFDINWLVTDGFELHYTFKDQPEFDLLSIEGWYNRTQFAGDTSRAGKNRQIPSLRPDFGLAPDQYLVTDVDGMSAGYRVAVTWGQEDEPSLTVGTDLIRNGQQLNDIVPEHTEEFVPGLPSQVAAMNFPVPRSQSVDFGVFAEHSQSVQDGWRVRTGVRVDYVTAEARELVPGMGVFTFANFPQVDNVPVGLSQLKQSEIEQQFVPWSLFVTTECDISDHWMLVAGGAYAIRPPSLTELYAHGPFIGSLQPGLTYVEGDPELECEKLTQIDVALKGDLGATRMSVAGFYAWVHDYITYDDVGERYQPPFAPFVPGVDFQSVAYTNTDLATLAGFELTGEQDITDWLTGFALVSYVEGRDHTRLKPSRMGAIIRGDAGYDPAAPRSFDGTVAEEPLPGIPPLEARLGLRVKDPERQRWAIELEARAVDSQDRVAWTLYERPTAGFTVWNLRGFIKPYERWTVFAGIENLTNRYYREHLDFRAGRGVFAPGVNFYCLTEVVY